MLNKLTLSLALAGLTAFSALAQRFPKEASIWYFGTKAGFKFVQGQDRPTALSDATLLAALEGATTISDTAGVLQFYAGTATTNTNDPSTVFNRNHAIMENGEDIIGGSSSTQNGIALKQPGNNPFYYLFSVAQDENTASDGIGFYYSVIDMSANGGLGKVDDTRKNVIIADSITEKVSACMHRNGRDIWVLSHKRDNNAFVAVRLNAQGVSLPVVTYTGVSHDYNRGALKLSPSGRWFACALTETQVQTAGGSRNTFYVQVGKFNDSTGVVDSVFHIKSSGTSSAFGPFGVEFSPDNSKLYIGDRNLDKIYQYDLSAGPDSAAIIASRYDIQTRTGVPTGAAFEPGAMQTGPDGRIYISKVAGTTGGFIACITEPNNAGAACSFAPNYVQLAAGTKADRGLTNILVNFTNGVVAPPIATRKPVAQQALTVRKTSTQAIATLPKGFSGGSIRVLNSAGAAVRAAYIGAGTAEAAVSIRGLAAGVYVVQVLGREEGAMQARIVVE